MAKLAIHTEQLTHDFKGLRAVDQLNLAIAPGTVFGLLGPAGAGKTTTVRLLLGLLEPSGGSATVLGYDVRHHGDAVRARAGTLLSAPGLYERLSAEENLDFYGRIWHLPTQGRAERMRELLEHFDLWGRRKEPIASWSQGMKQKLAVARALIHRPALLLLDEPTASLDPATALALRSDLAALVASEGVTVFLATSNLDEAEQSCQRLAIMHQGRLLADGTPDGLRRCAAGVRLEIVGRGFSEDLLALIGRRHEVCRVNSAGDRLWIDLREPAHSAPVVNLLVESGADVEEVLRHEPSLESLYLSLLEDDPK